jgi:hypothetical protein
MILAQFVEAIQPVYQTTYIGRASTGYLPNAGTAVSTKVSDGVSGWAPHPVAPVLLVVLATIVATLFRRKEA